MNVSRKAAPLKPPFEAQVKQGAALNESRLEAGATKMGDPVFGH